MLSPFQKDKNTDAFGRPRGPTNVNARSLLRYTPSAAEVMSELRLLESQEAERRSQFSHNDLRAIVAEQNAEIAGLRRNLQTMSQLIDADTAASEARRLRATVVALGRQIDELSRASPERAAELTRMRAELTGQSLGLEGASRGLRNAQSYRGRNETPPHDSHSGAVARRRGAHEADGDDRSSGALSRLLEAERANSRMLARALLALRVDRKSVV